MTDDPKWERLFKLDFKAEGQGVDLPDMGEWEPMGLVRFAQEPQTSMIGGWFAVNGDG